MLVTLTGANVLLSVVAFDAVISYLPGSRLENVCVAVALSTVCFGVVILTTAGTSEGNPLTVTVSEPVRGPVDRSHAPTAAADSSRQKLWISRRVIILKLPI
jgi:hypothetical protein